MPPAKGDHDARRRDVSDAVWRVLADKGFGGLTLRAVASEMGASTGLLTHYFPNKKALIRHALEVAEERTAARTRRVPEAEGLPALRAALLDVLPLSKDTAAMSRAWVSSWDAAIGDADLGRREAKRYQRWRTRLQAHVEAAIRNGEVVGPRGGLPTAMCADSDADDLTAIAAAFAHGLVVQALFDPRRFPAGRQTELLDEFLARFVTRES